LKDFGKYGLFALILFLSACGRQESGTRSAQDYYDLGRYASLAGDWTRAVEFFQQSVMAAASAGDCYYEGYASLQLATLWSREQEYARALDYAVSATEALDACGEFVGAAFSRLEMAWQYFFMGEPGLALSLADTLRTSFPCPRHAMTAHIDHLVNAIHGN
jgi:tetratricopeptide (TPR) repeat protein